MGPETKVQSQDGRQQDLTQHEPVASHLAVMVPVRHGVLPFSNLMLHGLELLLQEVPHVCQVAAIDPVVIDRDGVVLEGRRQTDP